MEELLLQAQQLAELGGAWDAVGESLRQQPLLMERFRLNSRPGQFTWTLDGKQPLALAGFYGETPFDTPFFHIGEGARKGWGIEFEIQKGGRMDEFTGRESWEITSLLLTDFQRGGQRQLLLLGQRVIQVPETGGHAFPEGIIHIQELSTFNGLFSLFHEQGHLLNGLTSNVMSANAKESVCITLQDEGIIDTYEEAIAYTVGIWEHFYELYQIDIQGIFDTPFSREDSAIIIQDELNANSSALTRIQEEVLDCCKFGKKPGLHRNIRDGLYNQLQGLAVLSMAIKLEEERRLIDQRMSPYDIIGHRFGPSVVNYLRSIIG